MILELFFWRGIFVLRFISWFWELGYFFACQDSPPVINITTNFDQFTMIRKMEEMCDLSVFLHLRFGEGGVSK